MPLARLHAPFDHPGWIFELKYDGFRAVAYVENGSTRLVSRKQNTYKSFPGLTAAMASALRVDSAVLDGEIVHLDDDGRPQFFDLMRRRTPQQFIALDMLFLNGRDLRQLPLLERKAMLRRLLPPQPCPVMYAAHVEAAGSELFGEACRRDLEGIVAKLAAGLYTPEETTWVKIKNEAYSQAEGRTEFFDGRGWSGSDGTV